MLRTRDAHIGKACKTEVDVDVETFAKFYYLLPLVNRLVGF